MRENDTHSWLSLSSTFEPLDGVYHNLRIFWDALENSFSRTKEEFHPCFTNTKFYNFYNLKLTTSNCPLKQARCIGSELIPSCSATLYFGPKCRLGCKLLLLSTSGVTFQMSALDLVVQSGNVTMFFISDSWKCSAGHPTASSSSFEIQQQW